MARPAQRPRGTRASSRRHPGSTPGRGSKFPGLTRYPYEVIRTKWALTPDDPASTGYVSFALRNPPSGNATKRWHWTKTRDERAQAAQEILLAFAGQRPWSTNTTAFGNAYGPCEMTVLRVSPRALDDDNLAGAFKHVRDAMVDLRILVDDGPNYLRAEYAQRRPAKGEVQHTLVTLRFRRPIPQEDHG